MTSADISNEKFNDAARFLAQNGILADAHHATIKKEFRIITGAVLLKEDLANLRMVMGEIQDEAQIEETAVAPDLSFDGNAVYGEDWDRVIEVAEYGKRGQPTRVVIKCDDEQVDGSGNSVCEDHREIAIQDLFQVQRCYSCQKRRLQIYRNELARKRRAESKSEDTK